jgi:uncharacterized spore protein YtfJ
MRVDDILRSITDRVKAEADVRTIYGETRQIGNKTVIPVARLAYGFGAGGGQGPTQMGPEGTAEAGGGGGGGGVSVSPVGFLVEENGELRFMPVGDRRRLLMAIGIGVGIGLLLGLRRQVGRARRNRPVAA